MRSLTVGVISLLIISAPVPGDGQLEQALDCSLVVDQSVGKSMMVTSVGQAEDILVTGLGECALTLLVVGGGGSGSGGGGGSGHLEYRSLQVTPDTVLTARVGNQSEASSLAINGGVKITAQPGQGGQVPDVGYDGGSGYCGGGGGGYSSGYGGAGGSDGGAGEDGYYGTGGRGSGQDVSLYTFTTWTLTPGDGGQLGHSGNYYFGGGGGGVLVDGEGPPASSLQGQGYGGGGGLSGHGSGLPGLILLEVN